jgi:nucleoside-diphosphate-sugar epimerase
MTGGRTVLVTGAAGSLGRRLLRRLAGDGWRTRALVHHRAVPDADETLAGDLADAASLARAVAGADAVVHLAAVTHARRPEAYRAVNAAGTARLLRAAEAAGVRRFLHISTRAISDAGGAYSASKLEAEELVAASAVEHVIVRLPEVYGAGGTEGIDDMVDRARRNAPIVVVGRGDDELRPVHVDDAIAALAAALGSGARPGAVYTLAGERHTARDVADICRAAFRSRSRIVGLPVAAVAAGSLAARVLPLPLYPDQLARLRAPKPEPSPEAAADLGFAPRSLADGLAATECGG